MLQAEDILGSYDEAGAVVSSVDLVGQGNHPFPGSLTWLQSGQEDDPFPSLIFQAQVSIRLFTGIVNLVSSFSSLSLTLSICKILIIMVLTSERSSVE